jgi:hypothetical protein
MNAVSTPGHVICPEVLPERYRERDLGANVHFGLYDHVAQPLRTLVASWLKRADREEDVFERFIFTYIAFNAWAAAVSEFDDDAKWRTALAQSDEVNDRFVQNRYDPEFCNAIVEFAKSWPIFVAKDLRRRNIQRAPLEGRPRAEVVELLRRNNVECAPACWFKHREEGSETADWPHTLDAIYRVRCNLFHGEKGADFKSDREIVSAACAVLLPFVRDVTRPR